MKKVLKERITISIDKSILAEIDRRIEKKIFANRSHALEFAFINFIKENDK